MRHYQDVGQLARTVTTDCVHTSAVYNQLMHFARVTRVLRVVQPNIAQLGYILQREIKKLSGENGMPKFLKFLCMK